MPFPRILEARYPTAIPCDICSENTAVCVVDTSETVRKLLDIVCFLQRNPSSVPHITPQAVVDIYLGLKGTKTISKVLPMDTLKSCISWTKHPSLRKDAVEDLVQKMVWLGNLTEQVLPAALPTGCWSQCCLWWVNSHITNAGYPCNTRRKCQ